MNIPAVETVPVPVPDPPAAPEPAGWNPLPARSRPLFLLGGTVSLGFIGMVGGAVAGAVASKEIDPLPPFVAIGAASASFAVLTALLGLWLGYKSYRYTLWRLDRDGLAVRRGKLWQRETRIPATRVQHLDLRRGPLQRRRDLATLVVHTAGTAHSSISVPNLDFHDAEALRDRLGRQIDDDDDDD